MRRLVCFFCSLLPLDNKKIVAISYSGRGYGDNPKYIVDELLKRDCGLKIVWMLKKDEWSTSLPPEVIPCRISSLKAIYHMCTSKIWLDNCRRTFMVKRKKQFYMQTWHGFALKRIEADAAGSLEDIYIQIAKKDSKHTDLLISDSRFMTSIYKNSFWYSGQVVEWGSPRNDIIILGNEQAKSKVRKHYNLPQDIKIVMYAPTFRANYSLAPYSLDFEKVLRACEEKLGGKFVFFTRLHPNIAKYSKELYGSDDRVIDATYYDDMQELLVASDIVISDYSSLMFDFGLSLKPCFQFATDITEYKSDRNFYFPIDSLPFPLSENNGELIDAINNFNIDEYKLRLNAFYESVGMVRIGNSASKCADFIIEKTKK